MIASAGCCCTFAAIARTFSKTVRFRNIVSSLQLAHHRCLTSMAQYMVPVNSGSSSCLAICPRWPSTPTISRARSQVMQQIRMKPQRWLIWCFHLVCTELVKSVEMQQLTFIGSVAVCLYFEQDQVRACCHLTSMH